MSLSYREAKRIIDKQEEAREVINSYRGMETLGSRLQLKSNLDLILKLFEIEEDEQIVEVMTHLKALYPEQWAETTVSQSPAQPGVVAENQVGDSVPQTPEESMEEPPSDLPEAEAA